MAASNTQQLSNKKTVTELKSELKQSAYLFYVASFFYEAVSQSTHTMTEAYSVHTHFHLYTRLSNMPYEFPFIDLPGNERQINFWFSVSCCALVLPCELVPEKTGTNSGSQSNFVVGSNSSSPMQLQYILHLTLLLAASTYLLLLFVALIRLFLRDICDG